ncbi:MAG: MBL fold metallo-hydrolase [Candidatus Lokiarchaeota archaeon]|nr:MBL fold metallo-hydrolase [Candidatus Lokiarchaeota archaeon]
MIEKEKPIKLDFKSIYFDLYELSPGIFAVISAEKLPTSNAGFFDLGNYSIIFDTLMDPFSTIDLIKASKQFTNKDPSFVIISHYHLDHVFGTRKFPMNIPIISSYETLLETQETLKTRFQDFKKRAPQELKRTEEALLKEENPDKILELKNDINTWNEIKDPSFTLRLPDFCIKNSITINGSKNQVQILYIGAAHSKGDIIALFEKERICFMGDLLFELTDPSWADPTSDIPKPPNPEHFRDTLLEYAEKDIEIYVPGHGNLCTKKEMRENAEFYDKYYIKRS